MFLLDGSDGTRNGFPAMRDFVQRVVEKLNVDENKDRVSVVQYSRDPDAHFYLNTYSTKGDVTNSIKKPETQRWQTPQHWGSSPVC